MDENPPSPVPAAPEPAEPDWLQKFGRLMVEGRLATHRSENQSAGDSYARAASLAERHGSEADASLAESAGLELEGKLSEAHEKLKGVTRDGTAHRIEVAWFYLGSVLRGLRRLEDAITSTRRAEQASFPWHSWALNNLGDLYELSALDDENQRDHYEQRALECYAQVLELQKTSPQAPSTYIQHYNYARLLIKRGCMDDALEHFRLALNESSKLTPANRPFQGLIRRDLGTALFRKSVQRDGAATGSDTVLQHPEKLDEAITEWQKAILDLDTTWRSRDEDLGSADDVEAELRQMNEEGARVRKARRHETPAEETVKAAFVRLKLRYAKQLRDEHQKKKAGRSRVAVGTNPFYALDWMPPNSVDVDGFSTPEEWMVAKIVSSEEDSYNDYQARAEDKAKRAQANGTAKEPLLAILRDWSSALPLVEPIEMNCRGGGYFLRWRGKGIVIDPGLDFLRNFHEEGFTVHEVNAIIVSHNHPDHNADLRALDDLCYELYNRARFDEKDTQRYVLVLDEQSHQLWSSWHQGERVIRHFSNRFRFDVFNYNNKAEKDDTPVTSMRLDLFEEAGLPFRLHYFGAQHSRDVDGAVGMSIECLPENAGDEPLWISFTCDTRFFKRLCFTDHLKRSNGILVAHVSQPDDVELMIPNAQKPGFHLGYRGVEKLIKGCDPSLTLLGEFWGGRADLRLDITRGLRRACPGKLIYPTSRTMQLNPRSLQVRCTEKECGAWPSIRDVQVIPPSTPLGPFHYLCANCARARQPLGPG